ncbi:MAG: formate/nitrite transporter family protein [Oscillospiraceae bacterium]
MMNAPPQIAEACLTVAKNKASMSIGKLIALGFFAGVFIALAGSGSIVASGAIANPSLAKLLSAVIFPVGLVMVIIAGAELFTGNNLMIVGILSKQITFAKMLRNWVVVYIANFVGSIFVAWAVNFGGQLSIASNAIAVATIKSGAYKCSLDFLPAMVLGILCNTLVCVGVWMSFGAKTVSGKIIASFLPIMLFVVSGYEHCIANMYTIPSAIIANANPVYAQAAISAGIDTQLLTWSNFFINNLIPVTLGNIIGGSLLVGVLYWLAYLKPAKPNEASPSEKEKSVSKAELAIK